MKVEVKRIGVLRTGIILAIFYTILAVIFFVPFMGIGVLTSMVDRNSSSAMGTAEMIIMPIIMLVFYPLMGFVGGIIMAALYNLVVKLTGGMQLELDVEPVMPVQPIQQAQPPYLGVDPGPIEM